MNDLELFGGIHIALLYLSEDGSFASLNSSLRGGRIIAWGDKGRKGSPKIGKTSFMDGPLHQSFGLLMIINF